MNAANVLTGLRLLMAFVLFGCLAVINRFSGVSPNEHVSTLGIVVLAILVVTLCTDFLDGYLARRMEQESGFGQVADPLVDKILICGTLIMLLGLPRSRVQNALHEWMVVIVVCRELFVQGLRIGMERNGVSIPAMIWGKIKMIVQSACVVLVLTYGLSGLAAYWFDVLVHSVIWLMVLVTLFSGVIYFYHAARLSTSRSGRTSSS